MTLPRSVSTYRVILPSELTEEQGLVLRRARRARIVERLCTLLGEGKISVSEVQQKYGALTTEVGDA